VAKQVAEGVWNLGAHHFNFYAIEDGGRITLVDAGVRRDWMRLLRGLDEIGHALGSVEAIVLTHAHIDHVGVAERTRSEAGARVHVHCDDEPYAAGRERIRPSSRQRPAFGWTLLKSAFWMLAGGGVRYPAIHELTTFDDGEVIDVPGRPKVHHTPGHTPGSVSFQIPSRDLLFTGDALVTRSMVTGRQAPMSGLNIDAEQARESLRVIERLDAKILLPGHGPPWLDGTRAAVALALEGSD